MDRELVMGHRPRNAPGHRGQSTLEMAVAMIAALLILLYCTRIFLWFAERFVFRQKAYEKTRVDAANSPGIRWVEPPPLQTMADEK